MDDDEKGKAPPVPALPEAEVLPELKHEIERLQLPEEDKQRLLWITMRAHAGPLPPADEFVEYGRAESTAPKTILQMAERQQKHDHWMDKSTIVSETVYRLFGMAVAGAIVLGCVYAGYQLVMAGHTEIGSGLLVGGTLLGLAGAFIRGRDMIRLQDRPPPPPTVPTPPRQTPQPPKPAPLRNKRRRG